MEKFTVDWFIDKFEKIPEDKIGEKELENHCVMWYCGVKVNPENSEYIMTEEAEALDRILGNRSWYINDGLTNASSCFPTPKQRILHALRAKKAMQNSEQGVQESDTTEDAQGGNAGKQKEKIRYVKISKEIEEMEFVEN